MTTTEDEPTLESIADSHAAGYWREFRLLARELLALRDATDVRVSKLEGVMFLMLQRLDGLEVVVARLPAEIERQRLDALEGREGGGTDMRDRLRWLGQMHATAMANVERQEQRAETAERERDLNARGWALAVNERDAFRDALLKFGVHRQSCRTVMPYSVRTGTGCTCGLTAALESKDS